MNTLVRGSVKAKFPGKRGYAYYHQPKPCALASVESWVRHTWMSVERCGGTVVQAYITPEATS